MTTGQYLLGAAELAVIAASLGLGAYYVRAMLVPAWSGALARLAEIILGLSALVVIAEVLGVLKLLEEVPLVAACAIVGLAGAYFAGRRAAPPPPGGETPAVRPNRAMTAVAVVASALVVAHWAEPSQEAMDTGMYYQDTTWYHMSFSGRFAQTGEVGPLHLTDPLKLTAWYYPQNAELLHAVPMVAMDTDFLSTLMNMGFLALALLAAWCIGRPYAVGAATLLGAAVVLDSEMLVASQAGNAPNDIHGLFFLLAVIAFLVNGAATARAAHRSAGARGRKKQNGEPGFDPKATEEHPQEGVIEDVPVSGDPRALATVGAGPLLLAGLAAGLGLGTKITLLATLGALTIGIAVLAGREGWLKALGIWLGGIVITSGFWYGRNLWHAANPLPQIEKLGPIDLPGPQQGGFYPREPHSLSEYYNDVGVWEDYFFPTLHDQLGPLWPAILLAAAASLIFALWWGRTSLMRVLAITGIVAGIAYVFTPLTASGALGQPTGFAANLRYISPALILALVLVPLVPAVRHRNLEWGLIAFFGLLVLQGTVRFDDGLDLAPSWNYGHLDESLLLALLVVGVPAGVVAASRANVDRVIIAAVGIGALVVAVAFGNTQRKQYLDNRYDSSVAPQLEGGFRSTPAWAKIQEFGKLTNDSSIGVVGRASAFGQYVFYGDNLSNYVQYLGEELNRGTFRQIANCKDLRRAINVGDYDYVVVTPRIRQEDRISPELYWVGQGTPVKRNIKSGAAYGNAGNLAAVYRIDGELPLETCAKAEERFRADKSVEQTAKEAIVRQEERITKIDLNEDNEIGLPGPSDDDPDSAAGERDSRADPGSTPQGEL